MIWLMTRFQVKAYEKPYVIKLPHDLIFNSNLTFSNSNFLLLKDKSNDDHDLCAFDLFLSPHGNKK